MVNLQGVPFGPFLRGLVRARRGQRWSELKQVFRQGIAARFAARTSVSLLPRVRLWSWRRPAQPPPLFQMAAGYWVSQSIYAAVKLGIPDAMQSTPKSCREIAALTGANEHSLYRLLRVLCSIGLCKEKGDKYELTAQGRPLQNDVPGSLRSMVLTLGQLHYQAWSTLEHSIKTGQPGFNHLFGTGLFQYLTENGEAGGIFNAAMTDYSGLVAYAVGLAYDFSTVRSVVDVGGGHGKFLTTILELNSHLRGTVFDLPAVIQGAKEHLAHFNGRCNAVAGDFFTSVPCGADAYVLSGVLHDWDDSSSIAILKNCRNAMGNDGRVLVVEMTVPDTAEPCFSKLLDLNMLVMCGGRERTVPEFRSIFQGAGLEVTKIVSTFSPLKVIEGRRWRA